MSSRDAAAGYAALVEAEPVYREARSYFDGTVAEVFTSRALKRLLRKTGDRFKMNVIRSCVTSISDRLELISVTVENATGAAPVVKVAGQPAPVSPVQRMLDLIWKENRLLFEAPNVMRNTSRDGDGYLLVWGEEPDAEAEGPTPTPVMNYISPTSMRVIYDEDNPRLKRLAVHTWPVKDGEQERVRVNLFYADRVERWITKVGAKPTDPGAWEEHLTDPEEPESWTTENPFDEVPVFHFRNETPYGVPEHLQGYGAQDAINKIVIAHMSTVDFHIAPQRYAFSKLASGAEQVDDFDLDDDDFADDESAETRTGREREMSQGVKSGPAEFWHLKGVDGVGQFAPADSKNFIDPAEFYLRMMSQTTGIPLHMLDTSGDEPSGESRRRKDAPLTKKVRDRQQMYAAVWAEALAFALKIAGFTDRSVVVRFAPAEVVSDAEGWSTIKAKIEAGVPVRQALSEAGYTSEQIGEWFPEGEENGFRIADLAVVADILQKIGAAVAMGIITDQEGRAMLPEGIIPDGARLAKPAPLVAPEPVPVDDVPPTDEA